MALSVRSREDELRSNRGVWGASGGVLGASNFLLDRGSISGDAVRAWYIQNTNKKHEEEENTINKTNAQDTHTHTYTHSHIYTHTHTTTTTTTTDRYVGTRLLAKLSHT
jgi:hypothetical protein